MPGSEHISPVCAAASYPAPIIDAAAAAGSLLLNDAGEEDTTMDASAVEIVTAGRPEMEMESDVAAPLADVKVEVDECVKHPAVSEQGKLATPCF